MPRTWVDYVDPSHQLVPLFDIAFEVSDSSFLPRTYFRTREDRFNTLFW